MSRIRCLFHSLARCVGCRVLLYTASEWLRAVADMASPSSSLLLLPPLALSLLAMVAPPPAAAHTYHMGKCPRVPPVDDFVASKKTSTRVRCLRNEYSWAEGAGAGAGEWAEEQAGAPLALLQRMQLPVPAVNNAVRYAGSLRPADRPGAYIARFPLSVARVGGSVLPLRGTCVADMLGAASYVVVDTDYDSFAAVYSCQQVALWYRHSASIMARGRTLSPDIIRKLRRELTAHGVNVDDLNEIKQSCGPDEEEQGIQVHIKPNVFRSNATALLEDANDSVKAAADAAKRAIDVYNTVQTVYAGASAAAGRRRRREARPQRKPHPDPREEQLLRLRLDWLP
ncbi:Apolipoprotein D [Gryllus bimaculatus]|nr:Apolipoprotein D [Gryllus bimaculatus]